VLTPAIATDQTDLVAPAGPVAARATALLFRRRTTRNPSWWRLRISWEFAWNVRGNSRLMTRTSRSWAASTQLARRDTHIAPWQLAGRGRW